MEASEHEVAGRKLACPFCDHNRFWTRRTLMNTRGATFFNLDWANREAHNYICEQCGYVLWFMPGYGQT
ncbi:MAG: DNA-binding protein [bacterium]|nr:DNA-binding protein [bacterium]